MSLPQIEINFRQKVATAIKRSAKGTLCMVVTDSNYSDNAGKHEYTSALNITGLDPDNIALVKQAFLGQPSKVIVIVVENTFEDAAALLEQTKFNWLVSNIAADQVDVVAYAKEKKCKTVVYDQNADDMHIVNFATTSVTLADGTTQAGSDYIVRIAGLLAGLPFTRSATYYTLTDLKSVVALATPADGEFYLINDGDIVRCARAVNSLVTLGENITSDMQKITTVEAMDLITEDIKTEFKNNFIGKYKNKYDYQALFISAVNSYFRGLTKESILDSDYDNKADVDIEEQRSAWVGAGKTEAAEWTDIQVKKTTFKSYLYILNNIKILDAIEDMKFTVELF